MTTLRETVLAELAKGTHTEGFADGARWAVQEAEKRESQVFVVRYEHLIASVVGSMEDARTLADRYIGMVYPEVDLSKVEISGASPDEYRYYPYEKAKTGWLQIRIDAQTIWTPDHKWPIVKQDTADTPTGGAA